MSLNHINMYEIYILYYMYAQLCTFNIKCICTLLTTWNIMDYFVRKSFYNLVDVFKIAGTYLQQTPIRGYSVNFYTFCILSYWNTIKNSMTEIYTMFYVKHKLNFNPLILYKYGLNIANEEQGIGNVK